MKVEYMHLSSVQKWRASGLDWHSLTCLRGGNSFNFLKPPKNTILYLFYFIVGNYIFIL